MFSIKFTAKADKELKKMPRHVFVKIIDKIAELENEPKPPWA